MVIAPTSASSSQSTLTSQLSTGIDSSYIFITIQHACPSVS